MNIDVTDALKGLKHLTSQLSEEKVHLATARAINHTIAKGKTQAKRDIRNVYNIKSTEIGKAITLKKSTRSTLQGAIIVSGSPIPIIAFSPRQTAKGVTVAIYKGKRKKINRAFIQRMKNGHIGVYARGKYAGNTFDFRTKRVRKTGADLPIQELTTTSVPTAFKSDAVIGKFSDKLSGAFSVRLEHELRNLMR